MRTHPVVLAGAGPGHPGLATLRTVQALAEADYVLYDRLVNPALLRHAPPSARLVCVDELPGEHPQRWPHIHAALIAEARQGRRVVRLKGGDPLVFGRGAEEAQALREAGLEYEIVPGVTAGLGASAFAGIPVTHRDHASAIAFVTGHEWPGKPGSRLDWPALARFPGTLVFYMGVARLRSLVETLLSHGKDASTPAAVVQQGTTARQRTVTAILSALPEAAKGIVPPALVIVGDVVSVRDPWAERLPLFGQRVLLTRPAHQAGEMADRIAAMGGEAVLQPLVDIAPLEDWSAVDQAISKLPRTRWVVFTSANGARAFLGRLRETGRDARALGGCLLAAIGPATAEALAAHHLLADLVPAAYNSETLAAELKERVRGQRVLLARADRGLELLKEVLGEVAEVEQVAVYRQLDRDPAPHPLVEAGEIDLVALTSSRIAEGFARSLGAAGRAHILSGRTRLVAISPRTAEAAGLPIAATAERYTVPGVLEAMARLVSGCP
ncbi:MAG: uroporphyrinogen-III C-methyltransferase [Gemmataceae bacterium]|nr:uroporphyrinogen-III C-methyltransferase [Gemmataceae bacterium]